VSNTLSFFRWFFFSLLVSKEREEDIVSNLDGINIEKTLCRRYKCEVDCVCRNPNCEDRKRKTRNQSGINVDGSINSQINFGGWYFIKR